MWENDWGVICMKVVMYIETKTPSILKKSLEPDAVRGKDVKVKFKKLKDRLVIEIEGKKASHIKGIINSYLTLINVINKIEDKNGR
jgi:tRNA threonylcarbamoyladenosine modification (KEOPS) complex  Pcc1 subunit